MLRSLLCVALLVSLASNVHADEKGERGEKGKAPEAAQKEVNKKTESDRKGEPNKKTETDKKAEPAKKGESSKELAVPNWIPKQFLGTNTARRLAQIQADLDAAIAKRGPARDEAHKARHVANAAEQKVNDLDRMAGERKVQGDG